MYGISIRREQLRSSSLGGRRRHGKKCHIILLYGDAARRSLRKFILLHGTTRARHGKGISLIRYCGSYGTPVLPEHPGWIVNRRTFPRSSEIYSRGLRMDATSAHCTGDDTRWNLSRVNRYDVIAMHERMHWVPCCARLLRKRYRILLNVFYRNVFQIFAFCFFSSSFGLKKTKNFKSIDHK